MLCQKCDSIRAQQFLANKQKQASSSGSSSGAAVPAGSASKSKATSTKECPPCNVPVVVNELLTYVNVYRDRASAENLWKILSGFYTASEINTAKKLMVCTFAADLAECPLKAERRKSTTRGVNEVEVDDSVGIFDYLDHRSNLPKATFAAANLERLPKYRPEEINICSIADKQSELGISVASLAARVDEIATDHSSTQFSSFIQSSKLTSLTLFISSLIVFSRRSHRFVLNWLMASAVSVAHLHLIPRPHLALHQLVLVTLIDQETLSYTVSMILATGKLGATRCLMPSTPRPAEKSQLTTPYESEVRRPAGGVPCS